MKIPSQKTQSGKYNLRFPGKILCLKNHIFLIPWHFLSEIMIKLKYKPHQCSDIAINLQWFLHVCYSFLNFLYYTIIYRFVDGNGWSPHRNEKAKRGCFFLNVCFSWLRDISGVGCIEWLLVVSVQFMEARHLRILIFLKHRKYLYIS